MVKGTTKGVGRPIDSDDSSDTREREFGGLAHTFNELNKTSPTDKRELSDMGFMLPTIGCVFLGTVIIMIIIFVIIKYCRHRDHNTHVNHQHIINPQPPPYCAYNSDRNCHVFHTQCDMCIQHHASRNHVCNPGIDNRHGHGIDGNTLHPTHAHLRYPMVNTGTVNPIFNDDQSSACDEGGDSTDSGVTIRDLYKLTDRSITQTIDRKLVVSVTHLVDHQGDVLYLDNMGISLKVPVGAIKRGDKRIIFLVLNWDLTDNPAMKDEESLVSPVVYVGPHGLRLHKPCTLIFRHCSYNTRQIRVMRSETELTVQKNWNVLHEQNDATSSCYMTSDECQLKIDTFTLYTCVQAPLENQIGKKWLQIAAFACPLRKDINHHQIRLYFLNKTPCALQWAIQNEANFGGKMICPEKVFLFDGDALDMFTKTRYVSDQWGLVDECDLDRISFLKIWHGHCPHISICYRRRERPGYPHQRHAPVAIEMNVHLFTYQNSREIDGEKIVIQISEDNVTPVTHRQEVLCSRHHIGEIVIDINPERSIDELQSAQGQGHCDRSSGSRGQSHDRDRGDVHVHRRNEGDHVVRGQYSTSQVDNYQPSKEAGSENSPRFDSKEQNGDSQSRRQGADSSLKVVVRTNPGTSRDDRFEVDPDSDIRVIPHTLRKELKLLLDAKHMFGSDWRDLAGKVGLDKCIPILKQMESPTEKILDCIEQHRLSLECLQTIFYEIEREDCALEIAKYLRTETTPKVPTENGDSSFVRGQENVTRYAHRQRASTSYRSLQERSFNDSNRENFLSANRNDGYSSNWVLYPQNIPVDKINQRPNDT